MAENADPNENPEQPEAVDLNTLTLDELLDRRAEIKAEHDAIDGSTTVGADRRKDLRAEAAEIEGLATNLNNADKGSLDDFAIEPPTAENAQDPAPTGAAPSSESDPQEGMSPAESEKVAASINNGLIPDNDTSDHSPTHDDQPPAVGTAIKAAKGSSYTAMGETGYDPTLYETISWGDVANRTRRARLSEAGTVIGLFSEDTLDGYTGPRLGQDGEISTDMFRAGRAAKQHEELKKISAALCGIDTEIDVPQAQMRDFRLGFSAQFTNRLPAQGCGVRFRPHLAPLDVSTGAGLWDSCKQAAMVPTTENTLKPVAKLPACTVDYINVKPFYTTAGLEVTVDDMFCRESEIQEASMYVRGFQAQKLNRQIKFIVDQFSILKTVEMNSSAAIDDVDHDPQDNHRDGEGFRLKLAEMITKLRVREGVGDIRASANWRFSIDAHLRDLMILDMVRAGENIGMVDQVFADIFQTSPDRLFFDKDYGIEGALVAPHTDAAVAAADITCGVGEVNEHHDTAGLAAGRDMEFTDGTALEALPTKGMIRVFDDADFGFGSVGVRDWQLRTEARERQNTGLYFAEERHIFTPLVTRHRWRLALDNITPNGQRIRPLAYIG